MPNLCGFGQVNLWFRLIFHKIWINNTICFIDISKYMKCKFSYSEHCLAHYMGIIQDNHCSLVLSGKEFTGKYRKCRSDSWVRKIPRRSKELATHSSILPQEIPSTEKPGRLHSPWCSKSVPQDLAIKQHCY